MTAFEHLAWSEVVEAAHDAPDDPVFVVRREVLLAADEAVLAWQRGDRVAATIGAFAGGAVFGAFAFAAVVALL